MTRASRTKRVLVLGAVNSPHLEHLVQAMAARGLAIHVAGYVSPNLPAVTYAPEIRVSLMPARALSRLGMPFHVKWIRDLLRTTRPDVVQAHGMAMFGFTAALARARPLVSVAWGSDILTTSHRLRLQDRYAISRSHMVMADTPMLIRELERLGASPRQVKLIGWGVDLTRFRPSADRNSVKRTLGLGPGPVILSPRGLGSIYNPATIIESFELVRRAVPEAQLVLKHPGHAPPPHLGRLPEGISLVGNVPYEALPPYFQAADVCVSLATTDSGPRSVWEAMACGVPCVVSDLPWLEGAVVPERDLLAVPIDAAAVAQAVLRILREPELARSLADSAHDLVAREHEQSHLMDAMRDLLIAASAG